MKDLTNYPSDVLEASYKMIVESPLGVDDKSQALLDSIIEEINAR